MGMHMVNVSRQTMLHRQTKGGIGHVIGVLPVLRGAWPLHVAIIQKPDKNQMRGNALLMQPPQMRQTVGILIEGP